MAKGVGGDSFGDFSAAHGMVESVLDFRFVKMVAPSLSGLCHHRHSFLRKEPLVDQFLGGAGKFLFHRILQENSVVSRGKVLIVKPTHGLYLSFQFGQDRFREGDGPVLLTFAVDCEQLSVKVEIPHPQLLTLEQSQTTPEQKTDEEPVRV